MTDLGDADSPIEPQPATPPGPEPPTGSGENPWISLLTDSAAFDIRPDLFKAAFEAIEERCNDREDPSEVVSRVIDRRLSGREVSQSLGDVTEGLEEYLGTDAAYLLHWLVYFDPPARLQAISQYASGLVMSFLRKVVAEHGGTIDLMQRLDNANMNDWARIWKWAYLDALTGSQTFRIKLTKLDGSTVQLESTLDSLVNLVTHLLELLNCSPSLSNYSDGGTSAFAEQLARTVSLLNESSEPAPSTPEPSDGATSPP